MDNDSCITETVVYLYAHSSDNINNNSLIKHGLVELNRNTLAIKNSDTEAASTFPESSEFCRLLNEKVNKV